MATLEERIQNLTQDINPMGAMSDMDRKIAMNAMPRQQSAAIMDMVGKTNAAISNREMEMFRNDMPTNSLAPSVSTLNQKRLEQAFKEIQSLAGVLTNKEQDMLSQANDPITLLTTLRDIKQNLRSSGRLMSDTDKEIAMNAMPSNPMQPLVEMGFGEQVDIILGNPADSDISRQAQQQIINEMGTGMDIDSFLMEVNNLAPKGAMTNIDAEGINQLMRFAVKQKVDESNNPLLQLGVETGRMNDTTLGHLSEGEAVIPAEVLEANPQAAQSLDQTMTEMGINPDSRIVDTTGQINGIASINPETGLQEFGIGSSFQKFRRKVLKPVAKIAAVVPGPWQAPAIIYNKLESGYNIASGKGGIGDLMTVMAGGTQKVGGEGGAWDRIKSGDFAKEGGGTGFFDSAGKALKNIGSVDGKFNPLQYGKNIASTYRDDQVGGYFGLLAGDEQPLPEEIQAIDNYETGEVEYVNTRTGQTLSAAEVKQLTSGGTNPLIKQAGNLLGFGGADDLKEAYGIGTGTQVDKDGNVVNTGTTSGGMGMMGKLGIAGLAGLIGKLAYEEAKNQKGVPLTPLTQMDQLGRYNIAAEMARQAGEGSPSRVEYGLNPEGMPALSGGSPRMAAYGGIMNLNMGGMPRYNFGGGVQYFNQGGMPRYNYGGGVQYFNQGGAVAMAEGGDMDATINIEEFPAKDGQIDGPGTEVSDDIPAMLSDGEFVMTAKAVKGAGAFNINDNNGILTLTPNGDPSRDSGTRVMYKLMEHFGKVA
jgi:hypothetical protein